MKKRIHPLGRSYKSGDKSKTESPFVPVFRDDWSPSQEGNLYKSSMGWKNVPVIRGTKQTLLQDPKNARSCVSFAVSNLVQYYTGIFLDPTELHQKAVAQDGMYWGKVGLGPTLPGVALDIACQILVDKYGEHWRWMEIPVDAVGAWMNEKGCIMGVFEWRRSWPRALTNNTLQQYSNNDPESMHAMMLAGYDPARPQNWKLFKGREIAPAFRLECSVLGSNWWINIHAVAKYMKNAYVLKLSDHQPS